MRYSSQNAYEKKNEKSKYNQQLGLMYLTIYYSMDYDLVFKIV
jgi:hypothetical protein